MADVRHFINGNDFGLPRNYQDLEITVDWLGNKDAGAINVSDLAFVLEANEYLQQRIRSGLTGGVGVFEGEPYTIEVGDIDDPQFTFNGYLDFTEEMTVLGGQEIICSLKKRQGEDWLNDVADGFSFNYLRDQGVIVPGDYIRVPYVINYVPDGAEIVLISISLFMMTKELIENIERLAESIADITDASTPVIGVGAGAGAVAVTAWDLGNFILVVLKTLARLAYVIAITIAIINLMENLFEQLLPKRRFHLGMTFRKLFERGCQHLGLRFQSSIQELDWTHIPRKDKRGGERGENGVPQDNGPIYTFGNLIREMKKMFNADYRIENGIFYLERSDKFRIPSGYQIPNFFNDQDLLLDRFKYNTNEMISNYNINWSLDLQDQNTLDNQEGRIFQAVTSPVVTNNQDLVSIKNLAEIALPFSIGRDKTGLTNIERIARDLARLVDAITGIFGGGTNFASQIENRVGSLLLTSHFLSVGKIVVMQGSNLARQQRTLLSARGLWDRYHFINSFAEYQGEHNQWIRFENQPVPMTAKEFEVLLKNNIVFDDAGNEYEIEKATYNPYATRASIDFRIKQKYTENLKIEFIP